MRFLNPTGLWLLLGIPILIIIYLIKAQHEERAVSSTFVWKLSERFAKKRLPFTRLRRIMLFILQLLLIIVAAMMAAKPVIVKGQTYELPAVTTEQYLEYCDVREPIAERELYTRKDFYAMADQIVKLYGNQFTREELLGAEGLKPGEVIVQFSMIETVLLNQVNDSITDMKENFTAGT